MLLGAKMKIYVLRLPNEVSFHQIQKRICENLS
jgi:hypothetical protein